MAQALSDQARPLCSTLGTPAWQRLNDALTGIRNNLKGDLETQNERITSIETKVNIEQNIELEKRLTEVERISHGNDRIINGISYI